MGQPQQSGTESTAESVWPGDKYPEYEHGNESLPLCERTNKRAVALDASVSVVRSPPSALEGRQPGDTSVSMLPTTKAFVREGWRALFLRPAASLAVTAHCRISALATLCDTGCYHARTAGLQHQNNQSFNFRQSRGGNVMKHSSKRLNDINLRYLRTPGT